jgi:hypothetical protein
MLDVRTYDCEHCGDVKHTLDLVDERIATLSERGYNSASFLTPVHYSMRDVKDLIYFKNILQNIYWNSEYYSYDYKKILSKVKSLI